MEANAILRLIVPEEILKLFDLSEIKERATYTELYLEEKKELIPNNS